METKNKQAKQSGWKNLAEGFVAGVFEHAGENLAQRIHKWISQMKRKAAGSLLLAVGVTFFLNSIALYINAMTQELFPWLGYSIVGILCAFVGYVMVKE